MTSSAMPWWNPFAVLERKLDRIINLLECMKEQIMSQFSDLVQKMDTNTSLVSDRIDALISKLAASGVDPADIAKLQAISDHLEAMGKSPTNPVPEVPAETV